MKFFYSKRLNNKYIYSIEKKKEILFECER